MRAVQVRPRGRGNPERRVHWLHDDGLRTLCGTLLTKLDVTNADLEVENLPGGAEGCIGCERVLQGWKKSKVEPVDERWYRTALPASKGRVSKAGPLRQTGRSGHGHRIF